GLFDVFSWLAILRDLSDFGRELCAGYLTRLCSVHQLGVVIGRLVRLYDVSIIRVSFTQFNVVVPRRRGQMSMVSRWSGFDLSLSWTILIILASAGCMRGNLVFALILLRIGSTPLGLSPQGLLSVYDF
ncbi:hypothetical protein KQX54_000048, partial [Cotesia glomerata]